MISELVWNTGLDQRQVAFAEALEAIESALFQVGDGLVVTLLNCWADVICASLSQLCHKIVNLNESQGINFGLLFEITGNLRWILRRHWTIPFAWRSSGYIHQQCHPRTSIACTVRWLRQRASARFGTPSGMQANQRQSWFCSQRKPKQKTQDKNAGRFQLITSNTHDGNQGEQNENLHVYFYWFFERLKASSKFNELNDEDWKKNIALNTQNSRR